MTTLSCDLDFNSDQSTAIVKIINIYAEILNAVLLSKTIALFKKGDLTVELFTKAFEYETNLWRDTSVSPRVTEIAIQTFYENTNITNTIVDMVNANKWVEALRFLDGLSTGSFSGIKIPMPESAFNQHTGLLLIPGANSDIDIHDVMDNQFYVSSVSNKHIEKIFICIRANQVPGLEINVTDSTNARETPNTAVQKVVPLHPTPSSIILKDWHLLELTPFPNLDAMVGAKNKIDEYTAGLASIDVKKHDSLKVKRKLDKDYQLATKEFLDELWLWVVHNADAMTVYFAQKYVPPNDAMSLYDGVLTQMEDFCNNVTRMVTNVVLHVIKQAASVTTFVNLHVEDLIGNINLIIDRECSGPDYLVTILKEVAKHLLILAFGENSSSEGENKQTQHLGAVLAFIRSELMV
jgi:hypothetical protein